MLTFHCRESQTRVEEIDWIAPEAVFAPVADQPGALWLDSSDNDHPAGRYSFIMADAEQVIVKQAHEAKAGFDAIDRLLHVRTHAWRNLPPDMDAMLPPFRGGIAGMLAYDLGAGLDNALQIKAQDRLGLPAMALGVYGSVLAFDHRQGRCFILLTGCGDGKKAEAALRIWHDRIGAARAKTSAALTGLTALADDNLGTPPLADALHSNFTRSEYENTVQNIIDRILAGEIFQANLAQCFSARLAATDTGFAYYRRLRRISPAPFSAYGCFDDFALASASPERFLHCRDNLVETRPIKGTMPRLRDAKADRQIAETLLASEKDRAENVMIVDLLRNDLARACADGTIDVPQLCALESFSNVHHLVSTVRGRLAEGKSAANVMRACFPGGSITGAPKIRAMQVIDQLEPMRRGPFYGSLCWLGFDGRMDSNILIRTALLRGRDISFQAGGGIVADSQPPVEYEETLNKARGLALALGEDIDRFTALASPAPVSEQAG